jgi:hypothetical protein
LDCCLPRRELKISISGHDVAVGPANSTATTTPVIVSSTSPSPVIANEGFYVKSFPNNDIQLFYSDGNSNIMSVQRVSGSWSSPVSIASDAKQGTTVSASVIHYHDTEDDDIDSTCLEYAYVSFTSPHIIYENISKQLYIVACFLRG